MILIVKLIISPIMINNEKYKKIKEKIIIINKEIIEKENIKKN